MNVAMNLMGEIESVFEIWSNDSVTAGLLIRFDWDSILCLWALIESRSRETLIQNRKKKNGLVERRG